MSKEGLPKKSGRDIDRAGRNHEIAIAKKVRPDLTPAQIERFLYREKEGGLAQMELPLEDAEIDDAEAPTDEPV